MKRKYVSVRTLERARESSATAWKERDDAVREASRLRKELYVAREKLESLERTISLVRDWQAVESAIERAKEDASLRKFSLATDSADAAP